MAFKAHDSKGGEKLAAQQGLGPSGLARRVAAETERDVEVAKKRLDEIKAASDTLVTPDTLKKRGRPALGKPWEALGISRAAYFRKKKTDEANPNGHAPRLPD